MATLAAAAKCRHYYSPMLRLLPLLGLLALLLVTGCGAGHNATGLTYFLVSETVPWLGDSYLLPLADPEDIAHARALIADPRGAGAPIVVARIARGSSDGITDNRDLLRGGQRWSWHVSEFLGFADATIEILDGSPRGVEAHLDEWLLMTNSQIGFWGYTVTRELRPWEL
jgi:hypothetical protein